MKQLLDFISSFGMACVLLLCMFLLTIFGTLFQVDHGLYEAKAVFFSSWALWYDGAGMSLPYFPGGLSCMALLSLNMLFGGFIRMRITSRNIGVVIIHLGVAFMLIAGLVKLSFADEGKLQMFEGDVANYFDSYYLWEVAIWDMDGGASQKEFVIGDKFFADLDGAATRTFSAEGLPFDLELSNFMANCRALPKGPNWPASGPVVEGFAFMAGKAESRDENFAAGLVAQVVVGGETQKGLLWGIQNEPWTVLAGGKRWAVDMRHERYSMPFKIRLEEFEHELHRGSSMDKAFRSTVTKIDGDSEERILIQMNEPLRDANLVLFQSRYGTDPKRGEYSVLSVVHNVSDKWPERSMWVITLGMLIAFGNKLIGFITKEAKRRAKAEVQA